MRSLLKMLLTLLISGLLSSPALGAGSIVVIYPQVPAPYNIIFKQIIEGIENNLGRDLVKYKLKSNDNRDEIKREILKNEPDAIIALGRGGIDTAKSLEINSPIIAGGAYLTPTPNDTRVYGISLTPDPDVIFSRLNLLSPKIKRIFVVYNPDNNAWLIELARKTAAKHDLELISNKAEGLREAAPLYRKILKNAKTETDAIWLPIDPDTVDDRIILPLILKEAWKKKLVIFSNKPSYVRNGVLFSLYPNNTDLGHALANIATRLLNKYEISGDNIIPIKDLLITVNIRTAQHIGIRFTEHQRRSFDLVFPTP